MSTEIIYGYFGTGKTTEMLKKIKAAAEKGEKCILFVPEQFSFEAEKKVYFEVGARNISRVKVTGFSKLSREIRTFYKAARPCADKAVKLITMWKVVDEVNDESIFKGQASADFCKLALKTVSAFKNAGITPYDYEKILKDEKNITDFDVELAKKADFFLDIYRKYNEILTEKLDDNLDDVSKAADLSEKNGYFKGCHLFFDDFDTFSRVQLKLIKVALEQCADATFCLSTDSTFGAGSGSDKSGSKREFLCVNKTVEKIMDHDPNIKFSKLTQTYRKNGRAKDLVDPVKVYSVKTPYDEADLIAATIHNGVREEGKRYKDHLILTADNDTRDIIADRLKCGGIPVFNDFPVAMTEKPLVNFILSALKACSLETEDILTLTEFGLMRQKYPVITKEGKLSSKTHQKVSLNSAYKLRCAAESYDLDRDDWIKGFKDAPEEELKYLERLREGIIDPLLKLKDSLENAKDGDELSINFMLWLMHDQDMLSIIKGIASKRNDNNADDDDNNVVIDDNDNNGDNSENSNNNDNSENSNNGNNNSSKKKKVPFVPDPQKFEEVKRIWDTLCEVFTSMSYCLKGKKISIEDYRMLLTGILSEITLANPPQVLDCVTVGDIERTRKSSPKTVIIAGFTDKNIPRSPDLSSVFTDNERDKLIDAGLSIYEKKLDRSSKELYFVKRAMELYEKDMILTYSYQDVNGRATERSGIISSEELENLEKTPDFGDDFYINSLYDLRGCISRYYAEDKEKADKLGKILQDVESSGENSQNYSQKVSDALKLLNGERKFSLEKETASALLGGRTYSPTSLEKMFECPFMYFGEYGLSLSENSVKDITAANNRGTIIHDILRKVLTEYSESTLGGLIDYDPDAGIVHNDKIKEIAAEAIEDAITEAVKKDPAFFEKETAADAIEHAAAETEGNDPISPKTARILRTRVLLEAMLPSITNILTQIALELHLGNYSSSELEKEVRYDICSDSLPESEGGKITIKGIADRIDLYTEGGKEYVRIFDYKSGKDPTSFSIENVAFGGDLQMLLYLFAECGDNNADSNSDADTENPSDKKERLPGEIGYFNVKIDRTYRMEGSVVNKQKTVYEKWYEGHPIRGAVFGSEYVKDPTPYNNAVKNLSGKTNFSAVQLYADKFNDLKKLVEDKIIVEKVNDIFDGKIEAAPWQKGDPCQYCFLKTICGHTKDTGKKKEENSPMDVFTIPRPKKSEAAKSASTEAENPAKESKEKKSNTTEKASAKESEVKQ